MRAHCQAVVPLQEQRQKLRQQAARQDSKSKDVVSEAAARRLLLCVILLPQQENDATPEKERQGAGRKIEVIDVNPTALTLQRPEVHGGRHTCSFQCLEEL